MTNRHILLFVISVGVSVLLAVLSLRFDLIPPLHPNPFG